MGPYRVRVDGGVLHLILPPTTFARRLLMNLVEHLALILLFVSLTTIFGVAAAAPVTAIPHDPTFVAMFHGMALVVGAIPLAIIVLRIVLISIEPSELERETPAEVTLRAEGLVITPRKGAPMDVGWTWVAGAREVDGLVELFLVWDRKRMTIPFQCDRPTRQRVCSWLDDAGLLRR